MDDDRSYQLATYEVHEVRFGNETGFSDGVLTVNRDELRALILENPAIGDVEINIASPGDDARVIHIVDVVEPRVRITEAGNDFPGVVGPLHPVGMGRTNRLDIAITQTVPGLPTESVHRRECIVDMSGDGARYSTFSAMPHIVLSFTPSDSLAFEDGGGANVFDGSPDVVRMKNEVRAAALRAGVYLASATKDLPPDHVETFAPPGDVTGLPRFLYMYQVQRPRYYGQVLPRAGAMTAAQHLPLFVNPAEVLDGALVAMSSIGASFREYTYLMQNNPVIKEMYRRHGTTIDFRGVLLCSNGDDPRSKQTVATASAGIACYVEADGVVLNHLGGGHAMVDVMRTCKELESLGIRTVLMLTEMSSTPGESGFIDYVTEADAIVSTGNFEEAVALKPVEKVYGGTHMMESGDDAAGPLNITVRHILAATSTAGAGTLSGADL